MVDVTLRLPDDVATQVAAAAAQRGVSVDELATEALGAYLAAEPLHGRSRFQSIGFGEGSPGFSAQEAERRLEDAGFEPSPSS